MATLAEELDSKLHTWKRETAAEVRERIAEVIVIVIQRSLHVPPLGA